MSHSFIHDWEPITGCRGHVSDKCDDTYGGWQRTLERWRYTLIFYLKAAPGSRDFFRKSRKTRLTQRDAPSQSWNSTYFPEWRHPPHLQHFVYLFSIDLEILQAAIVLKHQAVVVITRDEPTRVVEHCEKFGTQQTQNLFGLLGGDATEPEIWERVGGKERLGEWAMG